MLAKNFFISHPRSGRTWTKQVITSVIANRGEEQKQIITFTHYGYNPMTPRSKGLQRRFDGLNVTVLLRESKSTLASYFHFFNRQAIKTGVCSPFENAADFVASEFGVSRICNFLSDVAESSDGNHVNFLFYEDLFSTQHVAKYLPVLLGPRWIPDDTEIARIESRQTMDRTEQQDKYRLTLDDETVCFVDSYVDEHCKLQAYRDRYLTKED